MSRAAGSRESVPSGLHEWNAIPAADYRANARERDGAQRNRAPAASLRYRFLRIPICAFTAQIRAHTVIVTTGKQTERRKAAIYTLGAVSAGFPGKIRTRK